MALLMYSSTPLNSEPGPDRSCACHAWYKIGTEQVFIEWINLSDTHLVPFFVL